MAIHIGADISTIYIDDKAVDKVYVGDKLVYQRQSGEHYLTFSSPNEFSIDPQGGNWNSSMQYSTDAQTWIDWDGSTVSAAQGEDGYYLYLRGTGNTVVTGDTDPRWILTGTDISCIGNIETLLDYAEVSKGIHPIMGDYCFSSLFYNNSALINAPELPSPVLTKFCYNYMFSKTGITTSPELPATTLADYCYYGMFRDCVKLTRSGKIHATILAEYCCAVMFAGATNLTTIAKLYPLIIPTQGYNSMYSGCSKIKVSETGIPVAVYKNEWRIPAENTGSLTGGYQLAAMLRGTGGTFTGTPTINRKYYTSNEIV